MKRSALTIAISGLLMAGAAQAANVYDKEGTKADVYGRVVAEYYVSQDGDDADEIANEEGDQSFARFGFKGTTYVGNGVDALFKLENQLGQGKAGFTNGSEVRHLHAGLKSKQFGTVIYGRQNGLVYSQVANWTDMHPKFGGDALGNGRDKFGTGRNSGLLTYVFDANGLALGLQGTGSTTGYNESGYAASATYTFNGFSVGSVYNVAGKTDEQIADAAFGTDDAMLSVIGAKFEQGPLYLAANYSYGQNHLAVDGGYAEERQGLEAVAQFYVVPSQVQLGVAYLFTDMDATDEGADADYAGKTKEYTSFQGFYYFKPDVYLFTEYKLNLIKEDAAARTEDGEDVLAVGMYYGF